MKHPPIALSLAVVLFAATCSATSAQKITASEATNHIGQTATVCGGVASARYADNAKGKPIFLNLDKPYPNPIFTAVIWEADRPKFGQPELELKDKRICVTGKIEEYRGTPEIILRDRGQLKVE
jgi:DNA/RNA endonuclease YhcR with UshA esterase domain